MPKRKDIKRILVIGSGPIVIGQACEFDYSGSQACKALREEGFIVILINSNPATIMTDPEFSDRTYIEPLRADVIAKIIEAERPDALLPTLGGQTSLNLAVELAESGILEEYGVELIGAKLETIRLAGGIMAELRGGVCHDQLLVTGTARIQSDSERRTLVVCATGNVRGAFPWTA